LEFGVYNPFVQRHVVQAQYYKAPDDLAIYYEASGFLADINAEAGAEGGRGPLPPMWKTYRNNLASLDRLVLFQFDNDITVVPKESAHFAFYDGHRLVPVQETSQYGRLGLNELEKKGALIFEHAPGMHMAFTLKWFVDHVVRPYLAVRADQRAV
jgi:palmitoyl-protein thioesterase